MSTLTRSLLDGGTAAAAAATGFVVIAAFQFALASGAPLGQASWGGAHHGQLPTGLRAASAVAVGVWLFAALIVLGRAGYGISPLPVTVTVWGTWILMAVLVVGAIMNAASPSPWERLLWAPFTLTMAGLCFLVARSGWVNAG